MNVERPHNFDIDPPPSGRLNRIRDALRRYSSRNPDGLVNDATWGSLEQGVDVLTREGGHAVLEQQAALEVLQVTEFLTNIHDDVVPAESLPADHSGDESAVREIFVKWKSTNKDAISMIRLEASSFQRLRHRLKDGELWYFIERSHELRQTLTDSLAGL